MAGRRAHQHIGIRRQVFAGGLADQFGRALADDVKGGGDDVGRTLPRNLHQELAEVGLNDLDPVVLQGGVELDFLGGH